MVVGCEGAHAAGDFRQPVNLGKLATEGIHRRLKHRLGNRRPTVRHVLEAAEVQFRIGGLGRQKVDHHGRQKDVRNVLGGQ